MATLVQESLLTEAEDVHDGLADNVEHAVHLNVHVGHDASMV